MGKEKEKYEKPVMKTIELYAEEVMVTSCKIKTGGGPNSGCLVTTCSKKALS